MHFPFFEHSEGFPKGEIAHDVEAVVVEPCGGVEGKSCALGDAGEEGVGVVEYTGFVVTQG